MNVKMWLKPIVAAVLCATATTSSFAMDFSIQGTGSVPVNSGSPQEIQAKTRQLAMRDAVLNAIIRLNGPASAQDPKVLQQLDTLARQLPASAFSGQNLTVVDGQAQMQMTLTVDDAWLRKLINDYGLAGRHAGYKILVLMDEYHGVPTDRQKPLREVVEYSHDRSSASSNQDSNTEASQSHSSDSDQSRSSMEGDSRRAAVVGVETYNGVGYGAAASRTRVSASAERQRRSASSSGTYSSQSSASSERQNDVVNFRRVAEYLPPSTTPQPTSATYGALLREAAQYNLEMIDAQRFKSQFSVKPFTLQDLDNGGALDRFTQQARTQAKADYLMLSTVHVLDTGRNASTGQMTCDGIVNLKAVSTEDSRVLTATNHSESASGNTPEQCVSSVGNKLAHFVGRTIGSQIRNYAKDQVMNGREYTIELFSALGQISGRQKLLFSKALRGLKGLTSEVDQRSADSRNVEYSVKYSASTPIDEALLEVVMEQPGFEKAEVKVSGTKVKVCLEGRCQ